MAATAVATATKGNGTTILSIVVHALIPTENLVTWAPNPGFTFTVTDITVLQTITNNMIDKISCVYRASM